MKKTNTESVNAATAKKVRMGARKKAPRGNQMNPQPIASPTTGWEISMLSL